MSGRETVVLTYSGGLDSTVIAILLREQYGFKEVVPVLIDVGQGEEEIRVARERAKALGLALEFIDSRMEFIEDYIRRCIKANGSYQGYPVGTSMTRVLIASKAAELAKGIGAEAVAHGCTGKGNDQFRMEATFKYYAPRITVIAPVREMNLSRAEEEKILSSHGIDPAKKRGRLGGDVNMWSHSIGSGQVEELSSRFPEEYVEDLIWLKPPSEAPEDGREVVVEFDEGVPVRVDGVTDPVEMIHYLNRVGGENGVGGIDILEDGVIGLKSREVYEAPAATVLLKANSDLEHLTISKEQLRVKILIDSSWADIVYHGLWLHPLRRDLDAFIDSTQRYVSGSIRMRLQKGRAEVVERQSARSLFAPELRSVKRGTLDQRDATGAVKIFTIPFQLYSEKGR